MTCTGIEEPLKNNCSRLPHSLWLPAARNPPHHMKSSSVRTKGRARNQTERENNKKATTKKPNLNQYFRRWGIKQKYIYIGRDKKRQRKAKKEQLCLLWPTAEDTDMESRAAYFSKGLQVQSYFLLKGNSMTSDKTYGSYANLYQTVPSLGFSRIADNQKLGGQTKTHHNFRFSN